MKILLINSNTADSPYPVYPLGMSIISQALVQNGHTVKQIDFLQRNKNTNSILDSIENFSPDIIGISIRNIDNVNLVNAKTYTDIIVNLIKKIKIASKSPVVLGGSGYSLFPAVLLKKTKADFGFVGESETSFLQFIDNYKSGYLPPEKIIYSQRSKGKNICGALYSKEILEFYLKFGNMAPVQTKRGCQNNCIYCTYPCLEGKIIRNRNPKDVVKEIVRLKKEFGTKMIFFTDSVFNDTDGNFRLLLEEMKNQKIYIPWTGFFQPTSTITNDDIELMKSTGLQYLELGADAASNTTLKKLGKNFKFEDIKNMVELFCKHKIYTSLYYMFGGPGETKSTVREGIKNIKSIKKAISLIFMGIRILPGTGLEKIALKENIIKNDNDLFHESYYISSSIDKAWLEQTLLYEFKGNNNCMFPPDSMEFKLKMLHSLGMTGLGLDRLLG